MKILFLTMIISFFLKNMNFFLVLLSLEVGVLSLLMFLIIILPQKFLFIIMIFIMSSILGLIVFMISLKNFSNSFSNSWYF